jgi:uncharacterized protein YjbI with pentapeptide repeats
MMPMRRWVLQHKTAIRIILGIVVLIVAGIWFWGVLVGYVNPEAKGATNRKDVVQAFALIVAGVVAAIGAIVGIANLRQQRELEEQRAQEDAMQAYFEQMGHLLTDHNLSDTDQKEVRQLAKAQSLTVAGRLDQDRKGQLLVFLYDAGLINKDEPVVNISHARFSDASLSDANLGKANLSNAYFNRANLHKAYLRDADLHKADLRGATLSGATLSGADLRDADLRDANLRDADLSGADLADAAVTAEQLAACKSLMGATMPNGQKHQGRPKTKNN